MKNISDYIGHELEIVNKNFFKSFFDLIAEGIPILSLRNTDFWGNHHEISGYDKVWEITKPSIWKGTLEVKEKNSSIAVATFGSSTFGNKGTITLPRGEKLLIITHVWKSTYELQNELGTSLVLFKNKKWYSSTINVSIEKKAEVLDKYPFLIMLVFFTALQRHNAAAAAV